jgi:crossover junction endodeoxyribonuclease RusA
MIQIILSLPPSMNRLWRSTKGGTVYRSPKYTEWRTPAIQQITTQAKGKKIIGPYKLTMQVVRPDKRKRDLDNLLKAASDALVSAKVLEDHHCEWIDARWVKEGPECVLIIEEIK